jgi:hypothetical protein
MPTYEIKIDGKTYTIRADRNLSDAELEAVIQRVLSARPAPAAGSASARQSPPQQAGLSSAPPARNALLRTPTTGEQLQMQGIPRIVAHEIEKGIVEPLSGLAQMPRIAWRSLVKTGSLVTAPLAEALVFAPTQTMQAEKQAMVGKLEQYGQLPGPTYPELLLRSLVAPITSLWQTVTRPKEAYQEKGATGMTLDIAGLLPVVGLIGKLTKAGKAVGASAAEASALKTAGEAVGASAAAAKPSQTRAISQAAARVRWAWEQIPLLERLQKLVKGFTQPKPGQFSTGLDAFRHWLTDEYAPLIRAVDESAPGKELLPSEDPRIAIRLFAGFNEKFADVLERGIPTPDLQRRMTPGGLDWLLEPVAGLSANEIKQTLQQAQLYGIAKRTLELSKRFGREDNLSGLGKAFGEEVSDVDAARRILAEIADSPNLSTIAELDRRYKQWADATLRYAVEKGRLSQQAYEAIKANNAEYTALQRVLDTEDLQSWAADLRDLTGLSGQPGVGRIGSPKEPLHRIKGSEKRIKDPLASLLESTYRLLRESDRNEIMAKFVGLVGDHPEIARPAVAGEPHTIRVWRGGKPEYWRLDPLIAEAVKGFVQGAHPLTNFFAVSARVLRDAITHAPQFMVRNMLRDLQHRILVSRVGSGLRDVTLGTAEEVSQARRAGALGGGYYFTSEADYNRALVDAIQRISRDPKFIVADPRKIWDWWRQLSQKSEQLGRMSEYRAAYRYAKDQLGYDDVDAMLYAAYQSRDLIDFARAGRILRTLNRVIPFLNANVQGVARTLRAARENPATLAARWALYVATPELFVHAWNRQLGAIDEYKEQPAYLRDMFHLMKIGSDRWLAIPKPFEMGTMGGAVQRALVRDWSGFAGSLAKAWLPIDKEVLVTPGVPLSAMAQVAINRDTFRDRYIVPPNEEKLDLALRDTSTASAIGRALQEMIGLDARQADFLIQSFGGWGQLLTSIGKPGSTTESKLMQATGILRQSPAWSSTSVQRLLELAQRAGLPTPDALRALQRAYNQARTARQRQEIATRMQETAKQLMPALQEALQARLEHAEAIRRRKAIRRGTGD